MQSIWYGVDDILIGFAWFQDNNKSLVNPDFVEIDTGLISKIVFERRYQAFVGIAFVALESKPGIQIREQLGPVKEAIWLSTELGVLLDQHD
jgi:hypothetical protein